MMTRRVLKNNMHKIREKMVMILKRMMPMKRKLMEVMKLKKKMEMMKTARKSKK